MSVSQHETGISVKKLPLDKADRLRMMVCKIIERENVDLFSFDFTRTQGVDTNFQNLFEVIEEIKNSYIVDTIRAFIKTAIIIIFTNMDINQLKNYLSDDRWEPFIICKNNDSLDYINLKTNGSRLSFEKYLTSKLKDFAND